MRCVNYARNTLLRPRHWRPGCASSPALKRNDFQVRIESQSIDLQRSKSGPLLANSGGGSWRCAGSGRVRRLLYALQFALLTPSVTTCRRLRCFALDLQRAAPSAKRQSAYSFEVSGQAAGRWSPSRWQAPSPALHLRCGDTMRAAHIALLTNRRTTCSMRDHRFEIRRWCGKRHNWKR